MSSAEAVTANCMTTDHVNTDPEHTAPWNDPMLPTTEVAHALLGAVLHRRLPGGELLSGRIVETEAYLGLSDDACHSFHGRRTARVRSMYLPAGAAYVYLIYGLHLCLNVVTGDEHRPEAVLIRALEPLHGLEHMREHRSRASGIQAAADGRTSGRAAADRELCNGPGKLSQALALSLDLDGHRLDRPPLWIEATPTSPACEEPRDLVKVSRSARVGLSPKLDSYAWPLRFYLRGDPHVSKARGLPTVE